MQRAMPIVIVIVIACCSAQGTQHVCALRALVIITLWTAAELLYQWPVLSIASILKFYSQDFLYYPPCCFLPWALADNHKGKLWPS